MNDERRPWDRLPSETDRAYRGFMAYRDLGRGRSVDAAHQSATGRQERGNREPGRAPRRWEFWSAQHFWRERCRAWDDEQDRIAEEARAKAAEEEAAKWAAREVKFKEDAWKAVESLTKRAQEMLGWPLQTQTTTVEADGKTQHVTIAPARWSMEQAARFLEAADKIGRLVLGLATERAEVSGPEGKPLEVKQVPALDLSGLSTDELQVLEQLLAKAGGSDVP